MSPIDRADSLFGVPYKEVIAYKNMKDRYGIELLDIEACVRSYHAVDIGKEETQKFAEYWVKQLEELSDDD